MMSLFYNIKNNPPSYVMFKFLKVMSYVKCFNVIQCHYNPPVFHV